MELPKRKASRLPEYDYSTPGAYFVTICTHNRQCILSDIIVGADAPGGPQPRLTDAGRVVEQYILSTERIPGFYVEKYVIMPNHVHLILRLEGGPPSASDGPRGTSGCRNQCPWGRRRPLRFQMRWVR